MIEILFKKLHIKAIIRIETCNNFIMHIKILLCMMDDYEH
jgi:hypothetical protein